MSDTLTHAVVPVALVIVAEVVRRRRDDHEGDYAALVLSMIAFTAINQWDPQWIGHSFLRGAAVVALGIVPMGLVLRAMESVSARRDDLRPDVSPGATGTDDRRL